MNENTQANTETPSELDPSRKIKQHLASRGSRLGASILDSLILMVFTIPVMYFTGGIDGMLEGIQPSFFYNLLIGLFGIIVFSLINFKLLKENGQTVGKRVVGIKIVDLDGNQATLEQHLVKRYATYFLPGQIPLIGQVFSLVNILFIFGSEKRCLHDYVAGTQVVQC